MRRITLSATRHLSSNNELLASLPPETADAARARLELVDLATGALLYEAGTVLRHSFFPVTAVVSLVSPLLNGDSAEVAVVGREGVVGVCAFMGGGLALSGAVVQRSGLAWRISARDIADLSRDNEPVMQQLLRYTQSLFTQMSQTSACNRHHALSVRLCRWLLQHGDRQEGDELHITQERIAGLLGVRREGITTTALKLQQAGLIRYFRGRIQMLDRLGLEQHSCECYRVMQKAGERLGNGSSAWPSRPGVHPGYSPQRNALAA
jgi:CRP-like cAMP-binding protein